METKQKELDAENELKQKRFEAEEREREREHQFRLEQLRLTTQMQVREQELVHEGEHRRSSNEDSHNVRLKRLDIGMFDNEPQNLDPFLSRFETVCTAYKIDPELWGIEFSKCLSGPSLEVYNFLDNEGKQCYDTLVAALKKRFGISEGSYRKQFRTARPHKLERMSDFVIRLKSYLKQWLEKSHLPNTFEGLFELIVSQQFFQCMDKSTQTFIKENGKLSLEEMVQKAQNYVDAHFVYEGNNQQNGNKRNNGDRVHGQSRPNEVKQSNQTYPKREGGLNERPNYPTRENQNQGEKRELRCFQCGANGHKRFECPQNTGQKHTWNGAQNHHKSAACQVHAPKNDVVEGEIEPFPVIALVESIDEEYLSDLKYPYRGKALIGNTHSVSYMRDTGSSLTLVQEKLVEPELYTGKQISVVLADRCIRFFPEAEILIDSPCYQGKVRALVLKDPVYPLVIGNNIFQKSPKTGTENEYDIMSDDCGKLPCKPLIFENSAKIPPDQRMNKTVCESSVVGQTLQEVETKFVNDVVIGQNVISEPEPVMLTGEKIVSAVQTRAQVKRESRSLRPLKHTVVNALNVSRSEFIKMQKDDESLIKYWKLAEEQSLDDGKINFVIKDDLLYRQYKNPVEDVVEQLMVPEPLREKTVLYAHETTLLVIWELVAHTKSYVLTFISQELMKCVNVWCPVVICVNRGQISLLVVEHQSNPCQ